MFKTSALFYFCIGFSVVCSLSSGFVKDFGFSIWGLMFWMISILPVLIRAKYAP